MGNNYAVIGDITPQLLGVGEGRVEEDAVLGHKEMLFGHSWFDRLPATADKDHVLPLGDASGSRLQSGQVDKEEETSF